MIMIKSTRPVGLKARERKWDEEREGNKRDDEMIVVIIIVI